MILKDKRLLVCAELVSGDFICDIGTDHGYLPAHLILSGKCRRAAAADINEMPLEAAKSIFMKEGISDKADFYLSDGLKNVPLEGVTDIVIAGMGGELISRIIAADERAKSCGAAFILQPMSKAAELRRFLSENGFETDCEKGVREGRFIYSVMRCRYTGNKRKLSPAKEYSGRLDPSVTEDREYILLQSERLSDAAEGMKNKFPERAAELMKISRELREICEKTNGEGK
ncbi:MAG: class I SAM-dependent methyltransferase [Oscillospiraceae bacterium]|nr:class I SAM-dependent methyltransferase [Oscillospiraceae bacterium]